MSKSGTFVVQVPHMTIASAKTASSQPVASFVPTIPHQSHADICIRWPRKLKGPLTVRRQGAQCPLKPPDARSTATIQVASSSQTETRSAQSSRITSTKQSTATAQSAHHARTDAPSADPDAPVDDFAIIPNRPSSRPIVPPPLPPALAANSGRKPPLGRPASSHTSSASITESAAAGQPASPAASPSDSSSPSPPEPPPSPTASPSGASPPPPAPIPTIAPSTVAAKDLRDRFNYASIDCAAAVRAVNADSKGTSAILNENKDSYLLTPCRPPGGGPRHVVIELCTEILVDTLVVSNYELFSSTFRTVRAFVNSVYPETPEKPWRALATLSASNVRSPQVFRIERPMTWAKYVRLEFVDQHGAQYFCPLSNIRVYGTTMLEEYKRDADAELIVGEGTAEENARRRPLAFAPPEVPGLGPPLLANQVGGMIDAPPTGPVESGPTGVAGQSRRQSGVDLTMPTSSVPHPAYVPFLPPKLRLSPFSESVSSSDSTNSNGPGMGSRSGSSREFQASLSRSPMVTSTLSATGTPPTNQTQPLSLPTSTLPPSATIDTTTTMRGSPSTPIANPASSLSVPPLTLPNATSTASPPQFHVPPPPQQEEGIYKVIMKRFASVEANYKLLLQYMDDYAKGINEVIRANDENQSVHFSRAMAQLSQHVAARLGQIRDELAQEADDLRLLTHRHEEALTAQLARLAAKQQATEQLLTTTWRWSLLHFALFVIVALGPWLKSVLVTVLQVSLSASPIPTPVPTTSGKRSHRHLHHQSHVGGASPILSTGGRRSHQATSPILHHVPHLSQSLGGAMGIKRQRSPATSLSASAGLLMGRLASASLRSITGAAPVGDTALPPTSKTASSPIGPPRRISGPGSSSFSTRTRAKRRSYVLPTVVMEPGALASQGHPLLQGETGPAVPSTVSRPDLLSPRPRTAPSNIVLVPMSAPSTTARPAPPAAADQAQGASTSEWSSVSGSSSSSSPSPTLRARGPAFSLAASMPNPAPVHLPSGVPVHVVRMRSGSFRKRRTVSDPFLVMHMPASRPASVVAADPRPWPVLEPVAAMVVGQVPAPLVSPSTPPPSRDHEGTGVDTLSNADKENIHGAPPTPTPDGEADGGAKGDKSQVKEWVEARQVPVDPSEGNGPGFVGPSPPDSDCGQAAEQVNPVPALANAVRVPAS